MPPCIHNCASSCAQPEMLTPKLVCLLTPMHTILNQMPPHWQTTNQKTQPYEAEQPMCIHSSNLCPQPGLGRLPICVWAPMWLYTPMCIQPYNVNFMKLGKNDLRLKLLAKKRKVETSTEFKKLVKPSACQCENGQQTSDDNINKEPNILVACGKDIKKLKINNNRKIVYTNQLQVNQPKVMRNVKIIEAFEERIKKRAELDLEKLYFEDIETADEHEVEHLIPDELLEDVLNDINASDCEQMYQMAKMYLVSLKATLMQIANFINNTQIWKHYEEYVANYTREF